ncbi:MAG: OsmC family protein [Gemmatimonadaceae bacterium]
MKLTLDVKLVWPSLPPERLESAKRAAALCPVHQTLLRPPEITTTVVKE